MMPKDKIVEPFFRLALSLAAIGLTFFIGDIPRTLMLWTFIFIGSAVAARATKAHLLFLVFVCLPIFLGSSLIHTASYDRLDQGWSSQRLFQILAPVILTTARIAVAGLIMQTFFVPLLRDALLVKVLRHYGLRGHALVVVAGSIALIEDIRTRVGRISDSYKARGLMPITYFRRLLRVGEYLRPLFVSVLATAVTRADTWQNREMLERLEDWRSEPIKTDYLRTTLTALWAAGAFAIILMASSQSFDIQSITGTFPR